MNFVVAYFTNFLWILLKFLWYCLRILAVLFTNFCSFLYVCFVITKKRTVLQGQKRWLKIMNFGSVNEFCSGVYAIFVVLIMNFCGPMFKFLSVLFSVKQKFNIT